MKLTRIFRNTTVTALSLGLGLGTVACSRDYIADYVYTISSSTGTISGFAVDFQTGIPTQLAGSPFATQLSNPTTLVATPNGATIVAIGGSQNSEVEAFAVGTDGKIYGQHTYNITGTYPTAAAIDSTGSFLYVTYQYQNGYGPSSPGPGGVSIFPIHSDSTLGTAINVNVGNNPVAIAIAAPTSAQTAPSAGAGTVFAYVVDAEGSTASPSAKPTVLGFQADIKVSNGAVSGTGNLTPITQTTFSSTLNTYQGITAGVAPSAIAIDPAGRYVYVTDKLNNEIYGYSVTTNQTLAAGGGTLTPLVSSPFSTGLYPVAITIDPRGKYVYTANYNASTVSSYSLNSLDGSLGGTATVGNFATATNPTCVTVDPALGIYLFTSDYLNGSMSGGKLSPNTGQLTQITNSPFPTGSLPSCVVAVANGAHATQLVNP